MQPKKRRGHAYALLKLGETNPRWRFRAKRFGSAMRLRIAFAGQVSYISRA
jgi:hypothetical protein